METFPRYWPFVRGTHRSPVESHDKGQRICARINAWVYNRNASDLRHHRAHYDVIVRVCWLFSKIYVNYVIIRVTLYAHSWIKVVAGGWRFGASEIIIQPGRVIHVTRPSTARPWHKPNFEYTKDTPYTISSRASYGTSRADSRFVSSQWETVLLCNDVSHWLGTSQESALISLRQYFGDNG